jgi:hypothetical protein
MVAISQLQPDIRLQPRAASDRTVRIVFLYVCNCAFKRGLHQVIEQYKRQIFDHRVGSGGQCLKEELMKLSRRVDEQIPHSLGQDMTFAARAHNLLHSSLFPLRSDCGIRYEKMHRLIESVYADIIGTWGGSL